MKPSSVKTVHVDNTRTRQPQLQLHVNQRLQEQPLQFPQQQLQPHRVWVRVAFAAVAVAGTAITSVLLFPTLMRLIIHDIIRELLKVVLQYSNDVESQS
jgi:hypothetical protein